MTLTKRVDALTRRNGPAPTILADDHGDGTYTVDGQLLIQTEIDTLARSGAIVVMILESLLGAQDAKTELG